MSDEERIKRLTELAREVGVESDKSVLDLCRANTDLGMELVALRARIETLASEWDQRVAEYRNHDRKDRGNTFATTADALRDCANELRALLKESP